ncbi:uncharacterized protein [Littorina saxatilis]|uniref:Secreted protein n=1 Tax=Littorina saxatilis TaxID=31220 RepID=A0AAN9G9Z6_9CAEN
MYCLAAFFIIGALGTTPSVLGLDLDCFDENALESEMTKCFTQSGLSVDAHTVADVQTAILTNTSYVCRNTEAFKSAVSCVMGFARNCLISLWVDPAILPDANKMTDGLVYLCHHLADVDAKCFIGTLPTIAKCTRRKARAAHSVSDSDRSLKFIFCKAFDATLNCARQQLGVCPRRTKEIVVNFFTYVTPAACSGGDFPRSTDGGTSRVFLLFAALLTVICR